jgi:hypothetical protein
MAYVETNIYDILKKKFDKTFCVGIEPHNNEVHPVNARDIGTTYKVQPTYKELVIRFENEFGLLSIPYIKILKSTKERSELKEGLKDILERNEYNKLCRFLLLKILRAIERKEYGHNSDYTIQKKGFDWLMFDSGLMYKNLKAWVDK